MAMMQSSVLDARGQCIRLIKCLNEHNPVYLDHHMGSDLPQTNTPV